MSATASDISWMSRALELARRGQYTVSPNPAVGCVLVTGDTVVGEGWHQRAGGPHAEIHALNAAGKMAHGATAYVTLEPCSHHGKTGPCADALIAAGVARVVYGCEDPNPQVAGNGLAKLKTAGVEVAGPVLESEALRVIRGFRQRMRHARPWVTIKMAMSLDARVAMASGQSQWITAPAARQDVQRLRAASCAIVTGSGTALFDDPSLTVRLNSDELGIEGPVRQPLRVVIDSSLRLPEAARVLQAEGPVLVFGTVDAAQADIARLQSAGAEVALVPAREGKVDLAVVLARLAERGCNQVLVEAGSALAGAFVAEALFDELVIYLAPKLFGETARPLFKLPIETIDAHLALTIEDIRKVGEDWRISATPETDY